MCSTRASNTTAVGGCAPHFQILIRFGFGSTKCECGWRGNVLHRHKSMKTTSKNCPYCKSQLAPKARSCPNCGKNLPIIGMFGGVVFLLIFWIFFCWVEFWPSAQDRDRNNQMDSIIIKIKETPAEKRIDYIKSISVGNKDIKGHEGEIDLVMIARRMIGSAESGTEPIIYDILKASGQITIAEDMLNCGNAKLEDEATQWAKENGYKIEKSVGSSSVTWWR